MNAFIILSLLSLTTCSTPTSQTVSYIESEQISIDSAATTFDKRFLAPAGYKTV